MNVTTRERITRIEIENEIGKPTRIIFRPTTMLNELNVEIELPAKTLFLVRDNEDTNVPGFEMTYKQLIAAIKSLYGTIPDANLVQKI